MGGTDMDFGNGWVLTTWDAFPPMLTGPDGAFLELRPGEALVCGSGHPVPAVKRLLEEHRAYEARWPGGSGA